MSKREPCVTFTNFVISHVCRTWLRIDRATIREEQRCDSFDLYVAKLSLRDPLYFLCQHAVYVDINVDNDKSSRRIITFI